VPRSRIGLEIGSHSPWISRLFGKLGHEVIVANARKVRLIGESRKKDDRLDAQTLAPLARIDPELLYPAKHRSAQAQADLMMIRARVGLVRACMGLVNTARGLAKSYGERLRGCNVCNTNPKKAESLSPELQATGTPVERNRVAERAHREIQRGHRESGAQSYPSSFYLPRLASSASSARSFRKAKNPGDWPMKSPMSVRNFTTPFAMSFVPVGRIIEHGGSFRLKNGHGSGMIRLV
jgi:transposase